MRKFNEINSNSVSLTRTELESINTFLYQKGNPDQVLGDLLQVAEDPAILKLRYALYLRGCMNIVPEFRYENPRFDRWKLKKYAILGVSYILGEIKCECTVCDVDANGSVLEQDKNIVIISFEEWEKMFTEINDAIAAVISSSK